MSAAIVSQVFMAARAYVYISAVASALVLVWMASCCLLDRVPSRFFEPPTREPGDLWPEDRRQHLAATVRRVSQ